MISTNGLSSSLDPGLTAENNMVCRPCSAPLLAASWAMIEDWPTEEFQFDAYGQVAQEMGDRPVIIRTLDIGADKQVDYFNLSHEDNPALGYRAIRICLTRPEIFKVQLRALLRASAYGNIAIMLPMITSVQEVRDAKRILEEAKSELRGERIDFPLSK